MCESKIIVNEKLVTLDEIETCPHLNEFTVLGKYIRQCDKLKFDCDYQIYCYGRYFCNK